MEARDHEDRREHYGGKDEFAAHGLTLYRRRVLDNATVICRASALCDTNATTLTPCRRQSETLPITRLVFATRDGGHGFGATRRMFCTTDSGWSCPRPGPAGSTIGTTAATVLMPAITAKSPGRRRRMLTGLGQLSRTKHRVTLAHADRLWGHVPGDTMREWKFRS